MMTDKNFNTVFPGDYVLVTCPFCEFKTMTFLERKNRKCPLCGKKYHVTSKDIEKCD